jgi:dihydrofolate synthase / folylpolyglutamate synthase
MSMKVTTIKTRPIRPGRGDLIAVLDAHLSSLSERAILAVTSKIVAICEGRVVRAGDIAKSTLVEQEAEYFLPSTESKYGYILTIRHNLLVPSAGVDESNGDGFYVLWPEDPQRSANEIRRYLARRFSRREVGVILTDSTTRPLRWGVTGVALAHSGFAAVNDYVGQPDIFGRPLAVTKANVRDGLAAAAVLVMGEGTEQTPLALIDDVPFVTFQERDPTPEEPEAAAIALEDDLYAPLLERAPWQRGGKAS